jgi:hypothetical protein
MDLEDSNSIKSQALPLVLTLVVLAVLSSLVILIVHGLNLLPLKEDVALKIRLSDVLIGGTIYLKTAVDFAIFMGRLMTTNPGWKNRVAIEIGTALGNGLGTVIILIVWTFFKEVAWLLGIMVFLASLVLFELAFSSLEHFSNWQSQSVFKKIVFHSLDKTLSAITKITKPITSKVLPDLGEKLRGNETMGWKNLLIFSFTVPFILGLDDFAGYVPLFSIVNVLGFSIGVLAAHTILNIALFISPNITTKVVRNEWVSFLGALAFVGLAIWGLIEVIKIII